jgi:hypothetical protein
LLLALLTADTETAIAADPEIGYKFTWMLVHSLATRLAKLPATREEWQKKRNSIHITVMRRAVVVPVYLKNQTYRACKVLHATTSNTVHTMYCLQLNRLRHCSSKRVFAFGTFAVILQHKSSASGPRPTSST